MNIGLQLKIVQHQEHIWVTCRHIKVYRNFKASLLPNIFPKLAYPINRGVI